MIVAASELNRRRFFTRMYDPMTRRILVVDDMEFNRHHLRKILEADGFEVDSVADGRSAWDELSTQRFDLVITDLRMPDLNGLDLLAKVPPSDCRRG